MPATDAECGSSTRGHWDGPCPQLGNVMNGKGAEGPVLYVVLPGERFHANTIIHHVLFSVCCRPIYMAFTTGTCQWIFRLCIVGIRFGLKMRLCSVPVVCLRGGKYGALPLFWGVAGQNGGA